MVNQSASCYQEKAVQGLINEIKRRNGSYTVYEPETALELLKQTEVVVGKRRSSRDLPAPYSRGGAVTALVACGGDGTFNLVARVAMVMDLPVACLPLGKTNNIARSLYEKPNIETATKRILTGSYKVIDCAVAADQPFFGSIGIGLVPELAEQLQGGQVPRFGIGWSRLVSRVAAGVELKKTVVKVDSFRFEIRPIILNINLLPYSVGLPLSPASIADDGLLEIIFDQGDHKASFSAYARAIHKKKYLYGDDIRLYRGTVISCQPMDGQMLYLDGELIKIPMETLEIRISPKKLSVLC